RWTPQLRRHSEFARNRGREIGETEPPGSLSTRPLPDRQPLVVLRELNWDGSTSGRYYRRAGGRRSSVGRFRELKSCAQARPRNLSCPTETSMHGDTIKKLQDIGAFVLASGCTKKSVKQVAEMIRGARDYRFIAIYKIVKDEFVILAGTGNEPPTY